MTDRAPTVGEALAEFRRANGLSGRNLTAILDLPARAGHHPVAQLRMAPTSNSGARPASCLHRLSVQHARGIPDGRLGIRRRANAALGRRRILPAVDRVGLVLVTAANAGSVSRRARVTHAARSEHTRCASGDAAAFGAFPSVLTSAERPMAISDRSHKLTEGGH